MLNELFSLKGEVAIVIGGTGVLGGSMAQALASAGATVAIGGRSRERGEVASELIRKAGGKAAFFEIDAVSPESLKAAHAAIEKYFGPPTILVNAAGGNHPNAIVTADRPFESIAISDWQANFDLNLLGGAILPCQEFGPGMVARKKGSIINIASVSAHVPLSRVSAYSAAKAAVVNLTQFLAREWALANVRVNSLTPGFFIADHNRKLLSNEDGTPSARGEAVLLHTPMGRFGQPDELQGAIVFLASPGSSFVTGADLRVDGGFLSQTI